MAQKHDYGQICSFFCWVMGLAVGVAIGWVLVAKLDQDPTRSGVIALAVTLLAGLILRRLICRRPVADDDDDWVDRLQETRGDDAEGAAGVAAGAAVTGAGMIEPELQDHLDEDYVEEEEAYAHDEPADAADLQRLREVAAEGAPMAAPAAAEAASDATGDDTDDDFERALAESILAAEPTPEAGGAAGGEAGAMTEDRADGSGEVLPFADPARRDADAPGPAAEPLALSEPAVAEPAADAQGALRVEVPEEVAQGDDLTQIEGITDDVAVELYALGVETIAQLATLGPGQINALAEQLPGSLGPGDIRQWKRNARNLLDADGSG